MFQARYGDLGAIVDRVENGVGPSGLTARDGDPGADRTRPMCEHPSWPRYPGEGFGRRRRSFSCVTG